MRSACQMSLTLKSCPNAKKTIVSCAKSISACLNNATTARDVVEVHVTCAAKAKEDCPSKIRIITRCVINATTT